MDRARWFALILLVVARPGLARQEAPTPTDVKRDFLALLDRPRVPLDVRMDATSRDEATGLVVEHLSFATERKADGSIERVPALLVRPDGPARRRPVVIALHGTGGNKEGMRGWLDDFARRGIIGLAIDGRYHGERAGGAKGADAYNAAITRAWRTKPGEPQEHPFYFDTCWDIWRTIDYLQTREDVDPDRIGMFGISKGGIETWLAAAVDDRVKVAIPAISVQSFRWGLDHDRWQGRAHTIFAAHQAAAQDLGHPQVDREVCRALWSKVIPGILDRFDGPSMLRLFPGRALLILSGETDPNCPIEGAEVAFEAARRAYGESDGKERFKIAVAAGVGHQVTDAHRREALDWCVRWLRP